MYILDAECGSIYGRKEGRKVRKELGTGREEGQIDREQRTEERKEGLLQHVKRWR